MTEINNRVVLFFDNFSNKINLLNNKTIITRILCYYDINLLA